MSLRQRSAQQKGSMVRLIPYFASLSPGDLDAVASCLVERQLEGGQVGFLEGDDAAGLYLVVEGQAKILRISTEGREQVLSLLYPGDSCNEVPVVDGGTNPATFMAVEPTTVWVWTVDAMAHLRREIPRLDGMIISSLAGRCRELVDRVYALSFRSVTARLAGFLLEQADLGAQVDLDRRRWTQEEMAAHIGTVREMVGRALRNLERDGLIRFDRSRIQIADRRGLESLL